MKSEMVITKVRTTGTVARVIIYKDELYTRYSDFSQKHEYNYWWQRGLTMVNGSKSNNEPISKELREELERVFQELKAEKEVEE